MKVAFRIIARVTFPALALVGLALPMPACDGCSGAISVVEIG